jgi:hypothetical protein
MSANLTQLDNLETKWGKFGVIYPSGPGINYERGFMHGFIMGWKVYRYLISRAGGARKYDIDNMTKYHVIDLIKKMYKHEKTKRSH